MRLRTIALLGIVSAAGCSSAPSTEPDPPSAATEQALSRTTPTPTRPAAPMTDDPTGDGPIPAEWGEVIKVGGDIAGAVAGVYGAGDFIQKVLTKTGFLGADVDPVQQKLDQVKAKLDRIYAAIQDGFFQDRWRDIATQVGNSQGARTQVLEWTQAHPGGEPLPALSAPDTSTVNAMNVLMQPAYWLRPTDDLTYAGPFFERALHERAPNDGGVWDYRLVLPALIDVTANRLEVLTSMRPGFARTGAFSVEMDPLKQFLLGILHRMESGIRCAWDYRKTSYSGTPDRWELYSGCADIYTGASDVEYLWWWDNDQPSAQWAASHAQGIMAQNRIGMPQKLGIPQLKAFIDKIAWFTRHWKHLYSNGSMVTAAPNAWAPTIATPKDADGDFWNYDPDLRRLKVGDGRCLDLSGLVNVCDFEDPRQQWSIETSPPRLVHSSGVCADISSTSSLTTSPCDGRQSELLSFSRLASSAGLASAASHEHLDVLGVDRNGYPLSAYWDSSVSGQWLWHEPPPSGNLPGSAPIALVTRYPTHWDVFAVDKTGALVSNWRDSNMDRGMWHSWFPLTGPNTAPPGASVTAISRETGSMDVFVVGNNGGIVTAWYNLAYGYGWGAYQLTAANTGAPGGGIASASRDWTSMDVFTVSPSGAIATVSWGLSTGWKYDPNQLLTAPGTLAPGAPLAALSRDLETLDVFGVATDGSVVSNWWNLGYTGVHWNNSFRAMPPGSAAPGTSIAAAAPNDHRMDVYAIAPNGAIQLAAWDGWQNGGRWPASPTAITNPYVVSTAFRLAVASRYESHRDVFAVALDGSATSVWQDGAGGFSAPFTLPMRRPIWIRF